MDGGPRPQLTASRVHAHRVLPHVHIQISRFLAARTIEHQTVYSQDGFKAGIVSDLPAYFDCHPSLHYTIDVFLRDGVRRTYEQALEQARWQTQPNLPLFLIVEEHREFAPTTLNDGECFTMDECRNNCFSQVKV